MSVGFVPSVLALATDLVHRTQRSRSMRPPVRPKAKNAVTALPESRDSIISAAMLTAGHAGESVAASYPVER